MPTPPLSDIITHDVRVGATAYYLPEESSPEDDQYLFGYRILILNQGSEPARLLSRQWTIIDGEGQQRIIKGPGVVGQHPRLEAEQAFKYSSFSQLATPWGTMEGRYTMQRDDGSKFDIKIGRFYLAIDKLDTAEPDSRLLTDSGRLLNP